MHIQSSLLLSPLCACKRACAISDPASPTSLYLELQAKTHALYTQGLLARSSPLRPLSDASVLGDRGHPLLVLPNIKQAKLFDSDVAASSGGLQTVVTCGWEGERPGDLLFQMNNGRVQHVFSLVAHDFGFQVTAGSVSYPSIRTPTRVCVRLERFGRGANVALHLGISYKESNS